ncbi:hypothetical protein BC830DRAFT_1116058 [Chytriomyces sp. MP71]|nr:hypothetical protein BC830DRAFT_1116058 [Chytriomyces sp. MP71]
MTSTVSILRQYGLWTTQGLCITLLVQKYLGDITMCTGPSMLPTFNSIGDIVLIEHISWRWYRALSLGDVVVAVSPLDRTRIVCKRVLGLPGDRVLRDPTLPDSEMIKVPPGHVWLQGDNLTHSTDSRAYGPLPMGLLRGKVYAKLWPSFTLIQSQQ